MNKPKSIAWVTWEDHRRSRELADALGAEYVLLQFKGPRWLRYLILGVRTTVFVARRRDHVLFCQNPSIVLATLLCVLRKPLRFRLVVDRHSNFKFHLKNNNHPKWRIFQALSRWTIRKADLTIVTNNRLAGVVQEWGGEPAILQDKLPALYPSTPAKPPDFMRCEQKYSVMCVTSYGDDEPIEELVNAIASLPDVTAYMTGNYGGTRWGRMKAALENDGVVLTGFVSEQDYVDLMASVDAVVVLTIRDDILTCGAYEAVSLRKPLVLSDTEILRSYFGNQPAYAKPNADDIANAIRRVLAENNSTLVEEMESYASYLEAAWQQRFNGVQNKVKSLCWAASRPW